MIWLIVVLPGVAAGLVFCVTAWQAYSHLLDVVDNWE